LQFSCLRRLNPFRGETSDSGRNAVNGLFSLHDLLHQLAGLRHGTARLRRKLDASIFPHHLTKVAPGQVVSGELQIAGHQISQKTEIRKSKLENRIALHVFSNFQFCGF
jgi:hypothetical protein